MDLDIDDLGSGDRPISHGASRPSRFLPKSSKLKPKPKVEPLSEPELAPPPQLGDLSLKKHEANIISVEEEDSKMLVDPIVPEIKMDEVMKSEEEGGEKVKDETMEEAIAEDQVVREIDVFFQPSSLNLNTKLYVVQQPLRPYWRPYDFQKCSEVRVKPKSVKIEVDLKIEMDENYDEDVEDYKRITKQTLMSQSAPLRTNYAVGLLVGNKLHLNPVNAVVQLRPSMEHLKAGGSKKNIVSENADGRIKSEQGTEEKPIGSSKIQGKPVSTSTEQEVAGEESWVSLEYHGMDSSFSSKYRQRMAVQQCSPIQFSMSPYDYVNSLCPGSSTENNSIKGPSRSSLLTLPLDERFKKWFAEGTQVNRFNALKYLAPDDSNETILGIIQRYADLVQGLWVSKNSVLGIVKPEVLVRDYILLHFTKGALVLHKGIEGSPLPKELLSKVLNELAVYREKFKDWKFKEPTDMSFIKDYPEIVSEQERLWGIREKKIMEAVYGPKGRPLARNPLKPSTNNRPGASGSANQGPNRSVAGQSDMGTVTTCTNNRPGASDSANQGPNRSVAGQSDMGTVATCTVTMSDETREALPKALEDVFRVHKVCSLQLICQCLRDLAVSKSTLPKADARAAVAAAHGASAPLHELQSVINQVATNIHGVYVTKSWDNPALDPLRSVVIDLFSVKEPNAKLKKADIVEAAKIKLKRVDIDKNEYSQVLSELCVSVRGNAWMLRSGDGNQK